MYQSPSDEIMSTASNTSASRLRRQQVLAAEFGFAAIRMRDMDDVQIEACRVVCEGLGSRYAKVLRHMPAENNFLLIHGCGWSAEEIGFERLGADDASPAGYAFLSGQPVISNHLSDESRFRTPALLLRYGIERAINVIIRGIPASYGVLEADSPDGEDFTEVDIVFMEAIANVIAFANERILREKESRDGSLFSSSVLDSSTDCIMVLDATGRFLFMNKLGLQQMEISDVSLIEGSSWLAFWPAEEYEKARDSFDAALAGESARFEAYCPTQSGAARWWDVSVAPIKNATDTIQQIVSVARDITLRRQTEDTLSLLVAEQESQLGSSELMMQEAHHRVSNSLHLVHTLLGLQSNLASEKIVKAHLDDAAARVMTVGAVHKRLYQTHANEVGDAARYLHDLVGELSLSFASREIDRTINLSVEPMTLPASRLTSLGLVTTELVTNAVKYGKGDITVTASLDGDVVLLVVADQGDGFPNTFPTPQGSGLGMRLVKMYTRGGVQPVTVDRSVPYGRIVVRLPIG